MFDCLLVACAVLVAVPTSRSQSFFSLFFLGQQHSLAAISFAPNTGGKVSFDLDSFYFEVDYPEIPSNPQRHRCVYEAFESEW